jgi:ribose 5-phosphate isomerase B
MRIIIASDHGGLRLKNELAELLKKGGHTVDDIGTHTDASVDYPDFAHAVAKSVGEGKSERGILVCGTGVGMSIAANRHAGIRAVLCSDTYTASLAQRFQRALHRRARSRERSRVGDCLVVAQ